MVGCLWLLLLVTAIPLTFVNPLLGLAALVAGFYGLRRLSKNLTAKRLAEHAKRLAELTARFGDVAAVHIMNKRVWQGATPEMIVESIGKPLDIDERVMKEKTRHTFKYHQTGKNKFGLRVTFEEGICVGWDDKR